MKIIWSARAKRNAYDAAAYIAKDKPQAARSWLDGVFASAERISRFPESGRIVSEIGRSEIREIVYGKSYRIIYRLRDTVIEIVAVVNCAQRLRRTDIVIK